MVFVYLLMALFGAAAVAFAAQNPDPVRLTFLVWTTTSMPLSFALLMSAFVGVVVASVSAFAEKIQLQRHVRALERQVASLAAESWPPAPLREPIIREPMRDPMRERLTPPPPDSASEPVPVAHATTARTTVTRTEVRPPI